MFEMDLFPWGATAALWILPILFTMYTWRRPWAEALERTVRYHFIASAIYLGIGVFFRGGRHRRLWALLAHLPCHPGCGPVPSPHRREPKSQWILTQIQVPDLPATAGRGPVFQE